MNLINGVKEHKFLNSLNWDVLSCHDKALCVAAESLKPNASLYFILFKIMGRDYLKRQYDLGIGDDKYYDFLGQLSGVYVERKYGSQKTFLDDLKKVADSNKRCVLMINTKYQKGARLEGKKDHPHFMAYQGYDSEYYYFIDEDWSRQYWKTKDVEEVIYCQRKITSDELIEMSTNIATCNIFDKGQMHEQDAYMYYLLSADDCSPCCLSSIKDKFLEELEYLVLNNYSIINYAKEQIERFRSNLDEYRNKMVLGVRDRLTAEEQKADEDAMKEQIAHARRDELFAIRTRFIYPCESEIIGAYYFFLYAIQRVLKLRTNSFACKEKIIHQIEILLNAYDYVKLQIARAVLLGDEECVTLAWNRYLEINKKCMTIYKNLLSEAWMFEEEQE